ncbi:MAG TPA: hypothetical protein VMS65_11030, partial [Polyangiaceae bacterium]|nr:hypothetical protein [Polyangiaceae bacterium]
MTDKSAALGVGTLAAVVAAFPAVPRVTAQGANAVLVTLLLVGGTTLVLGPALVFASAAGGRARGLRSALYGLALAAAPLAVLGAVLKQGTHHRPLGAATFAVLALVTILFFVLVAWRVLRFTEAEDSLVRRGAFIATTCAALASAGFVVVCALGAPSLVPHVLDGLRVLSTGTLAYLLLRLPRVTLSLGRVGGPLWAFVVVAGLVVARGDTLAVARAA